jgi:hypothetical protein
MRKRKPNSVAALKLIEPEPCDPRQHYRGEWRSDVNIDERRPGLAMELVKMQVDVVVKAERKTASTVRTLRLNCFHLPSMRFRFIFISLN